MLWRLGRLPKVVDDERVEFRELLDEPGLLGQPVAVRAILGQCSDRLAFVFANRDEIGSHSLSSPPALVASLPPRPHTVSCRPADCSPIASVACRLSRQICNRDPR